MAGYDRLFIKNFDNYIYTIRKIIYFGNAIKSASAPNPKHEKIRFVNYFGWETNEQYYNSSDHSFNFSNDSRLKDEFANIYTYKSMLPLDMGDSLQLFSALSSYTYTEAKYLASARNLEHFNILINKKEEVVSSGAVLVKGHKPYKYKRNTDIVFGMTDDEKKHFLNALDFAIKKNNFSSFASTYKKLVVCRDSINYDGCCIDIDHQLFHPILDELHIWEAISSMSNNEKIGLKYIIKGQTKTEFKELVPLKIVYDNMYGRSYLICFNLITKNYSLFRFDRVFSVKSYGKIENIKLIEEKKAELESRLSKAWLVSLNETIKRVIIRFKNTVALRERIKNEGRHGCITEYCDDYFIYQIYVNDPFEMVNWILNFGSDCMVCEPIELVDRIVKHLEDMAK